LAGGQAGSYQGTTDFALFRFTASGVPDPTFGAGGRVVTPLSPGDDRIAAIARRPSAGKIYAVGDARAPSGLWNYAIARFLDERHPDPPLFPADPAERAKVEEAERWANGPLQMAARRIPGAAIRRDPGPLSRSTGDGRMGHLLYKRALARRVVIPWLAGSVFAASANPKRDPADELPALLDRVDAFIAEGVLGRPELNAADFMVAPSLALILYRPDVTPMFEGRPALELVDRLLPAPA
jgi:glutathione S-transferase